MMYRRPIGKLLADSRITEHPEVRTHLAHLEAQHRRRLAGGAPSPRKPVSVPARQQQQFTMTIPLSAEMIAAFKQAEQSGTLHIDMTALDSPVSQDTPERRPRRIPPRRKAEGPTKGSETQTV